MLQSSQTEKRSISMRILSDDQIWEIRQAAYDVIERVGFKCRHKEAQKMFAQAGAIVKDNIIRIPQYIVESCLSTTPKGWTIYNRKGERAMELERRKSHYGTSTSSSNTKDLFTGEFRETQLNDIAMGAKIADSLQNIDFVMPMGSSLDVSVNTADLNEFPVVVANTVKPIVFIGYSPLGCEYVYEMAAVIAGGMDELRRKPFIIAYPKAIAPLTFPDDIVDRIFVSADRYMPQLPGSTVQGGSTGPVTMAGMIVQMTAESLIHITIAQLRKTGCPVSMSANAGILNMSSGLAAMGLPENSLALSAQAEVAQSFALPTWGLAGATDSKCLDAQAGLESAFSILSQGLAGLNLIHNVGCMAGGMACSVEQLVMGNEIIGMAKRFIEGITINRETLAREVIEAVGPGGDFLQQKHTIQHFRDELWESKLLNHKSISQWESSGRQTMESLVKDEVRKIVETHTPEHLNDKVAAELERLRIEGMREIKAKMEKG
ncbi:MAG: trimethylamine methyltransferase family protein [Desulfamplus sp.]|nr:trimethylamine methyltransferase family protein [Desulfamplus sp.]MBF0413701.1 trimethylamine methyltransferase family protein [Desulfamplus sp.]